MVVLFFFVDKLFKHSLKDELSNTTLGPGDELKDRLLSFKYLSFSIYIISLATVIVFLFLHITLLYLQYLITFYFKIKLKLLINIIL